MRLSLAGLVSLLIASGIVLPARAGSEAMTGAAGGLEEVVVAAQRRSENLQTIPLDVTALSAADLSSAGVTNTSALSLAVPGLMYAQGANTATPFIRGVGTTNSAVGAEGGVATYVDGVYVSSLNATLFELNNIERVEVLKGPQGTLFGRNATGGVVHIITRDPSFTPSADVRMGYGNYDTVSGSLYATTGLSDTVAVDLAAYGRNQANGWGTDLVTGADTFTRHDFGVRSKVMWMPGEGARIVLAANYDRARNEDGLGYHVLPSAVAADGVTRYNGFYNTYDNPNDFSDVSQTALSVTAQQDLTVGRVVSITSWRNADGFERLDQDSTPKNVALAPISQHARTVTEEVQMLSPERAAMSWIAGLYYFNDVSGYDPLATRGGAVAPLDERQIRDLQRSESYSAFGQVEPKITTNTRLTFGARYTLDRRAITGSTLGVSGSSVSTLAAASQSASWSKVTWRVALDHHFAPDVMGYVSADRGFRSGVYNLTTYTAAPVRPETLDAYQLGLKTELADHRLRLNATAFYYHYQDMQIQKIVTGTTELLNAGAAVMEGLDVDFAWKPNRALSLRGGFELMRGHYTNFRDAPFFNPIVGPSGQPTGGNAQSVGDATNLDTVRTPKRTATVGADYLVWVPHGDLHFAASYSYNSGFAWDPDNRLRQSSYDVLNASAEWNAAGGAWGIQLWGRNITGTQYCVYAAARALLDSCSPAPPRTYGVSFSMRYHHP
jgi:iron complex outermembrane receptor protein